MSDDDAPRGPSVEILARVAETLAEGGSADLTALLGREAELKPAGVESIGSDQVCTDDDPIVHQLCRAGGSFTGDVHVLLPRPDACRLAALQQGAEGDDVPDASLDAEARAALQVAVKLFVDGFAARLCEEDVETSIDLKDAREIPEPASDPTWLPGESFQRLRFDLALERMPAGRIDLLVDADGGAVGSDGPGSGILFVAGRESEGQTLEGLASALGWPVSITTLENLAEAPVSDAGAIVIPWQVAGRAGIELAEDFSRQPATCEIPVVMAAERPTRPIVHAALRAGARGFTTLPYDGPRLRAAILRARGEAPEAPPAAETAPEAPEADAPETPGDDGETT